MKRIVIILTTIAIVGASATSFSSSSARADGGQVAAGILGGLAAGTILGAATAPRPYYASPRRLPHFTHARFNPADIRDACVEDDGMTRLDPKLFPSRSVRYALRARVV